MPTKTIMELPANPYLCQQWHKSIGCIILQRFWSPAVARWCSRPWKIRQLTTSRQQSKRWKHVQTVGFLGFSLSSTIINWRVNLEWICDKVHGSWIRYVRRSVSPRHQNLWWPMPRTLNCKWRLICSNPECLSRKNVRINSCPKERWDKLYAIFATICFGGMCS